MGNFINEQRFIRFFHPNDDFGVINIGYDDFSFVKAAHSFRVQNFYTWHFVISGKGILEIGVKKYTLSEGDSFFIPPNEPMRYFPIANDPWDYVWFALKGKNASLYGEQLHFSLDAPTQRCHHFEVTKQLLKRMIENIRNEDYGYYKAMSVFYELMNISTLKKRSRPPIQSIRELIDESYTIPDFSIENLCREVGYSHSQLLRLFKAECGKTVQRYVIEKRLSLACELLENSNIPIHSVALSCGFTDEIHFMKSFKAHYGVTATQYRKQMI